MGSNSTLAPNQIASGFLPLSLFQLAGSKQGDAEPVTTVVFAILRNGSLFSIERNQGSNGSIETAVGSPVVSLTVGVEKSFTNLPDPVIINVRIQVEVITSMPPFINSLFVSLRTLLTHDVCPMTLIYKVQIHNAHVKSCVSLTDLYSYRMGD